MGFVDVIVKRVASLGGVARRGQLAFPEGLLRSAVTAGLLVKPTRGVFALPDAPRDMVWAARAGAVLARDSAAKAYGWSLLNEPQRVHLLVPRGRAVGKRLKGCTYGYRTVGHDERLAYKTDPITTVLDCARALPFADALAVADSATREGAVGVEELRRAAAPLRGNGSAQARRVAEHVDPRAANAFESATRALTIDVPGLSVTPQVVLIDEEGDFDSRPDLIDTELGLVIECDSFQYHGSTEAFRNDRQRYTRLLMMGWIVVTLTWDDVVHSPDETRERLAAWVQQQQRDFPDGRPGPWRNSLRHADPA